MRNSETGEFELVVGNRQLLSGFFIVVLLLAVTFAMGYVVGQNSPRSAKVVADTNAPPVPAGSDSRPAPAGPVPVPPSQPSQAPDGTAAVPDAPSGTGTPTQPAPGGQTGAGGAAEKPAPP